MMIKPKYVAAHTHGGNQNDKMGVGGMDGAGGLEIVQGGLHLVFLLQLQISGIQKCCSRRPKANMKPN